MLNSKINQGELDKATLTVTVSDDFESAWIATQEDGTTKWECHMPDYDPETREPFTTKEEVEPALKEKLRANPNYWEGAPKVAESSTISLNAPIVPDTVSRSE